MNEREREGVRERDSGAYGGGHRSRRSAPSAADLRVDGRRFFSYVSSFSRHLTVSVITRPRNDITLVFCVS